MRLLEVRDADRSRGLFWAIARFAALDLHRDAAVGGHIFTCPLDNISRRQHASLTGSGYIEIRRNDEEFLIERWRRLFRAGAGLLRIRGGVSRGRFLCGELVPDLFGGQ